MALVVATVLALALAAFWVGPLVVAAVRTGHRRRQIAREQVVADIRLRQIAQAGFLALAAESRRTRDGLDDRG